MCILCIKTTELSSKTYCQAQPPLNSTSTSTEAEVVLISTSPATHPPRIVVNTKLHSCLGSKDFMTSSRHHPEQS